MKIPKYFLKWFNIYGWMDDMPWYVSYTERSAIERIAWRTYRKGFKDAKHKFQILTELKEK